MRYGIKCYAELDSEELTCHAGQLMVVPCGWPRRARLGRERDLLLPGDGKFLTVILKEDRVAVS